MYPLVLFADVVSLCLVCARVCRYVCRYSPGYGYGLGGVYPHVGKRVELLVEQWVEIEFPPWETGEIRTLLSQ